MPIRSTRRQFISSTAAAATAATVSEWAALLPISPASAADMRVTTELVRFGAEIEPIVALIEKTPREKCVEAMMLRLRDGLPYRQFLAALYLAAIRAAKWHGGIHGFDHNAYVVHSANQLALDLPVSERLLPAFYAMDNFKVMQQVYPNRPGTAELTGTLPSAESAGEELRIGMEQWDPERAERAIVVLIRSRSMSQVLEQLWRYAGRDWRFIGHMAILVSNSCRLLETIGWQHAEHVLRYVAAGLAGWPKDDAEGPQNQPYPRSLERVRKFANRLPADWAQARGDEKLTTDLLTQIRTGDGDGACDLAIAQITSGKAKAGAIWDAAHLAASELVLSSKPHNDHRPVNSNALHSNTACNALHYAFRAASSDQTRLLLALQALAWMPLYRKNIIKQGHFQEQVNITQLDAAPLPEKSDDAIDAIFASRTAKVRQTSRMAFAFAERENIEPLLSAARRTIPTNSSGDPHDIKFPVAIFEDLHLISPNWRPHVTAAAAHSFWGSERPELPGVQRVREAMKSLS